MLSIDDIIADVLRREGGFVDDPDDPGGATNFGVTIHTMRRLGLDLDVDGDVDRDDVRKLTRDKATDIFREHYFIRPRLSDLPEALQPSIFDMYVNAGGMAVRILQKLVAKFGHPVAVDGAIGPITLAAAYRATKEAPLHFVDAYGIERRNYYYNLADRRPSSRKYATRRDGGKGGWITRAESFVSPRFHLTLLQHRQRISQWA